MSSTFQHRLKRLHDAHQRGRDNSSSPSGVYEADGVLVEKQESKSNGEKGEKKDGPRGGGRSSAPKESAQSQEGWCRFGAQRIEGTSGHYFEVEERLSLEDRHGGWTIGESVKALGEDLSQQLREHSLPLGASRNDLLFMDTETTGLGEDSYAFMIGVGYFQGREFHVRHLLIDGEHQEKVALESFGDLLRVRPLLVTFNGKSFDLPLLRRRFDVQHLELPEEKAHLDLLHMARKAFPERKKYRLSSLEEDLLEFQRTGDIPGRKIPGVFARFQRSGLGPMDVVIEHNRHDIVSMVTLLATLSSPRESRLRLASPGKAVAGQRRGQPRRSSGSSRTSSGSQSSKSSKGSMREQLERTYRLRESFQGEGPTSAGRREGGDRKSRILQSLESQGLIDSSSERENRRSSAILEASLKEATAGEDGLVERCRRLKAGATELIELQLWEQAFALLTELAALSPSSSYALQQLARYYRLKGEEQIARSFDERLRGE